MDETPISSSIKKRLSLQNEILKRISEISEKLEQRANDVTVELHSLLDQAGAVEIDLKNTFNSFRSLSYTHEIDHRISDGGDEYMKREEAPVKAGIPAQDYETDILPRYKEALSLGLTSCKNHFEKKSHSTRSYFSAGTTHGPLPHIIGSEEYIHDNSCGLTEEFAVGTSLLDFSHILEPTGASSAPEGHDPPELFGSHMFGMHQDPPEQDEAALDFKAMLEAALMNTYKFYDEDSSSGYDAVGDSKSTGGTQENVNQESSTSSQSVLAGSRQHLNVEEEQILPTSAATDRNLISPQDADIHDHELYSSLLSGSLFDTEEPGTHDPVAGGPDISLNGDEEEFGQKASSENVDALVKDLESLSVSPDGLKDSLSTSIMSYHGVEAAEEPHASYQPVTGTRERGNLLATETTEGQQSDTDTI